MCERPLRWVPKSIKQHCLHTIYQCKEEPQLNIYEDRIRICAFYKLYIFGSSFGMDIPDLIICTEYVAILCSYVQSIRGGRCLWTSMGDCKLGKGQSGGRLQRSICEICCLSGGFTSFTYVSCMYRMPIKLCQTIV